MFRPTCATHAMERLLRHACILGAFLLASPAAAADAFAQKYCHECHAGNEAAGGLDLTRLGEDLDAADAFAKWVKVHDRVAAGEMPPREAEQPEPAERAAWLGHLAGRLIDHESRHRERDGRIPARRLTRAEYEHTVRDLLALDGIPLLAGLPEDGSAHGFDKTSDALDISHVNLARYVEAADAALDMAIAVQPTPPRRQLHRFSLARHIHHILTNGDAVLLRNGKADDVFPPSGSIAHVGPHEHIYVFRESLARGASVGVFRHEDESFKPYFYDFAALYPGRYRIRTSFWSFQWNKGEVKPGRGVEAARLSVVHLQDDGRGGGHPSTILGYFDAPPEGPQEHELVTWLNPKDTLGFNVASLAPVVNYTRPDRALGFQGPGIASDWIEIDGPIHETWPPEGHRRLFGDLPFVIFEAPKQSSTVRPPRRRLVRRETQAPNQPDPPSGTWTVASAWPRQDADRLLASFLPRAFRRPVPAQVRADYLDVVVARLEAGDCFETAMRHAYRAALVSPDFLYHREAGDRFDAHALASRLSYLLWNSMPDEALVTLADTGKLHDPKLLREQVERLLKDPKSQRFIDDFLGQWLNLRKIAANDPDRKLYPEFSPYLQDSMLAESRAFFREMVEKDLDVRYLVRSDFAMVNEKLATLYGIPGVRGSAIRRVPLPPGSPRGCFLTQAAVLKVTANGTTTSPVPRGAFVMARLLGQPPEPPPPNIPAVEPDVQGAATIREQLAKHRSLGACAGCHAKIDPPGFALESFDVIGGQRDRYRSLGAGDPAPRAAIDPLIGISFKVGPKVDPSGVLPDGRSFTGIADFQALMAGEPRRLLTALARHLCVYATGRPVSFADRSEIAAIVERVEKKSGGVRTLIHEIVGSRLFLPSGPVAAAGALAAAAVDPPQPTVTRASPAGLGAATAAAPEERSSSSLTPSSADARRTETFRLVGLSTPERVADLQGWPAATPGVDIVAVDAEKHEITLSLDVAALLPQMRADQRTPERILQRLDEALKAYSFGMFSLRPPLGAARAGLRREDLELTIAGCKACRLCVYRTAMGVAGVEQAAVDPVTGRLTVWLDPASGDLTRLREAMTKSQIKEAGR